MVHSLKTLPTDCIHEICSFLQQSEFRTFYYVIHKCLASEEQNKIKQLFLRYTFNHSGNIKYFTDTDFYDKINNRIIYIKYKP